MPKNTIRLAALPLFWAFVQIVTIQAADVDTTGTMERLKIVLIDQAEIPSSKEGAIAEFFVREGDAIQSDQSIARLDDREAQSQLKAATTELEIAKHKLQNQQNAEIAEKKLAQQIQLQRQHQITLEIAETKANNQIRILASKKAEAVAKNELERARMSRDQFIDSVSQSEIDSLQLSHERTILETKQAELERRLDALQLQAEEESADAIQIGVQRTQIEREAALADVRLAQLDVQLFEHQHRLAKHAAEDHQIKAPWNGVVSKRYRNVGEWIKRGEPVARLIRLDRLRAEGFASAELVPHLREQKMLQLHIDLGDGRIVERQGEIVFVSPELDPVNQERAVWIEFDNPRLDVLPGMRARMSLK
ncbi:MAG: HlyD family efflux transporter periplasmic adaptor subunit [Planctomycetota bacterium]